jgi:hypothetical protein
MLAVGLSPDQAALMSKPLMEIPEAVLESTLDSEPESGLAAREQRYRVLQLMRLDPRPGLRRAVADMCANYLDAPWEAAPLLAELANDPEPTVREAVVRSMVSLLTHISQLDQPTLLAEWGTSPKEEVRSALAKALPFVPLGLGIPSARTLLAKDPSPEVSQAIVAST